MTTEGLDPAFADNLEAFAHGATDLWLDGRWLTPSEIAAIVAGLSPEEEAKIEEEADEYWREEHRKHYQPDPEGYCPICYPEFSYPEGTPKP